MKLDALTKTNLVSVSPSSTHFPTYILQVGVQDEINSGIADHNDRGLTVGSLGLFVRRLGRDL